MTASAPLSFDHSREQVEAMMEQGMAFSNVEDVIDASEFSSVYKAALWLLAWSLRDVEHQRQDGRLRWLPGRRLTRAGGEVAVGREAVGKSVPSGGFMSRRCRALGTSRVSRLANSRSR